jgi:hypothetical protein
VLALAHDVDGDLQIVCGAEGHETADWRAVGLVHVIDALGDLAKIPLLEPGQAICRDAIGAAWRRE